MDKLITTYLEMTARSDFKPSFSCDPSLTILQSHVPLASFYRFLYNAVGAEWRWVDRNRWTDEQIETWLAQPTTQLFVLYVNGTPGGYVELDCQPEGTEIAYFGLIRRFFGHGYGAHLLSYGIQWAWDTGARRVWVHTCNLDGPHALKNYERRGFRVYHVDEKPMPPQYQPCSAN
jgi:GNAT superfamily N-acetyltransferase